ncbi:FecR domain-containing protein [Amphritea balenae]|nr:FecR domain-containing protein [Amphritea balenae]GGK56587.1 hypothetical protein GCM10007941_03450 [Amphritea balenae]
MKISWLLSICLFINSFFYINISHAQEWIYTTVAGDNLWNISKQHLDNATRFKQLQQLNNIENPRQIKPGTRLRVPLKWIRSNPVPARISSHQGKAHLLHPDGTTEIIGDQTLIQLGDQIRTHDDSSLTIRFADNSLLTLYSNSLIRFDHLSAHGSTGMVDSRLHLLKGRMDTRVTPAVGPGSRFQIQTPSAISAVRGTEYRAAVNEQQQLSNIEVLHGSVAVSGASKQRLIMAGYGTQITQGEAPIPAKKLLPPPAMKPIQGPIHSINQMLSWPSIKGAREYRIEVSTEPQFNTLVWQQISTYSRVPLPDLPDGQYYARIRGVDQLGLEGENHVTALDLDARPQPPIQLSPADNKSIRGTAPQLQWTESEEADYYRLEIATDSAFQSLILDRDDIQGSRFDTSALPLPGHYFWRLTSITSEGEIGPVGMQRNWQVKPIPKQADTAMSAVENGQLSASWPAGSPGQTYQIQLAYDAKFTELETDQTLAEPGFSFAPIKGRIRYLRVRTIEPDGYEGPWGTVQKVMPIPDYTPLTILGAAVLLLLL